MEAQCPLAEVVGPSSLYTAKGWSKADSVRYEKRIWMGFHALARLYHFRALLREIGAPWPLSHVCRFPSKLRMFLTKLGSLELCYRAKGTEEMCGGGSAFPCKCGATAYGSKLRDNCL